MDSRAEKSLKRPGKRVSKEDTGGRPEVGGATVGDRRGISRSMWSGWDRGLCTECGRAELLGLELAEEG